MIFWLLYKKLSLSNHNSYILKNDNFNVIFDVDFNICCKGEAKIE